MNRSHKCPWCGLMYKTGAIIPYAPYRYLCENCQYKLCDICKSRKIYGVTFVGSDDGIKRVKVCKICFDDIVDEMEVMD